jgi:PPOX class probable FMN-dependent enzyme
MSAAGDLPETTDKITANEGPVDLDALYAPPSEMIQKAVLDHLVDFHLEYLNAATFFCLATGSDQGLDASPRGGPAGFVHALDAHTVAFADWPGNNRIESLRNLQQDGRLGMLFIFPGLEIFMRINGRGELSTDPALLARLAEGERLPKTATVVRIDQVLLHCGKAVNRARLWRAESQLAPGALPSVGKIIAALGKRDHPEASMDDAQIEQINQHYDHSVRHDLY